METRRDELRKILEDFQSKSIGTSKLATKYEDWEKAKFDVLSRPELLRSIPDWVSSCRWGSEFWQFIKPKSSTYAGREKYIRESLAPVFEFIELGATKPAADSLVPLLGTCTSSAVAESWSRIQVRREADPEGAITAARSLLEGTCKYVLDQLGQSYGENDDLLQLYGKAASAMNLGPQNHNEKIFKQILSGCISVVSGLAALRNSLGDAHGKASRQPKPSSRHADLAINLGSSISAFLIATYEERFNVDKLPPNQGLPADA